MDIFEKFKGQEKLAANIDELGLKARTRNALMNAGVKFVAQILFLTEGEIYRFGNFGETSMNDLKECLNQEGLRLEQLVIKNFSSSGLKEKYNKYKKRIAETESGYAGILHIKNDPNRALKAIAEAFKIENPEFVKLEELISLEVGEQVVTITISPEAKKFIDVLEELDIKPGDLSNEFADAFMGVLQRKLGQEAIAKFEDDGPPLK